MKRIVCLTLSLLLILGMFAGCGTPAESVKSVSAEPEETAAPTAAPETPAPEESNAELASAEESVVDAGPVHQLPLTEEPITLTMFTGMNPNLMSVIETYAETGMLKWLEEETGVHIDVPAVHPASQAEKWTLMLASGDYSDFLYGLGSYPGGVTGAVEDEIVYDLNQFREQMPLFFDLLESDEEVTRDCTLDTGAIPCTYRIYGGDYYQMTDGPVIRADWLKELNLEVPETYDEYYEVLKAFKNEYGATMWFSPSESPVLAEGFGIRAGYTFGMGSGLDCWYQENGTVQCGFFSEEFKEYMELMQKWYAEGLLNPDFAMVSGRFLNSVSGEFAKVSNGNFGVWLEEAAAFTAYDGYDMEIVGAPIPRKNHGDVISTKAGMTKVDGQQFAIATTCEHPELAAEWLDIWYTDEGTEKANWGTEGETYVVNDDGSKSFTELITNNPDGIAMSFARELFTAPTGGYIYDFETRTALWGDKEFDACKIWNENVSRDKCVSSFISMTTEESEEYSALSGDIITYISQALSEFIMCQRNLDGDLDAFLDQIREMGIERCQEIEQVAYDRYMER